MFRAQRQSWLHWAIQIKDELKREQTIIRAQKKRINQKTLVVSEFASGFQGIDQQIRKEKEKRSTKKFVKK